MAKKRESKSSNTRNKLIKDILEHPYLPHPYKVIYYNRDTPEHFTIRLDCQIKHDPGQFVLCSIPGIGESAISISSYSDEYLELTINQVGNLTNALAKLKVGDKLLIRGPYGKGYPMQSFKGNNVIIVGGGCGVAPMKGIIEYLIKNRSDYKDVYLFLGYRTPEFMLFKNEIPEWKKLFKTNISVDKNPGNACFDGYVGFVTNLLKESNINNDNKIVFICGPPMMIKIVLDILKQKGFNDDQIYLSMERLMNCGIGVCGHCMIHGKYTCKDGPVFRYDTIKEYKND